MIANLFFETLSITSSGTVSIQKAITTSKSIVSSGINTLIKQIITIPKTISSSGVGTTIRQINVNRIVVSNHVTNIIKAITISKNVISSGIGKAIKQISTTRNIISNNTPNITKFIYANIMYVMLFYKSISIARINKHINKPIIVTSSNQVSFIQSIINLIILNKVTPTSEDFSAYIGCDFSVECEARDSDNIIMNISNTTITGFVKRSYFSLTTIPLTINITDAINGKFTISLSNAQTSTLKAGNYHYSVMANITALTKKKKLLTGILTVYN